MQPPPTRIHRAPLGPARLASLAERVNGARPLELGEVELVTAFRKSARQVIKMTDERESIMEVVFSGNARHERKSASAWVARAVACRAEHTCKESLSLSLSPFLSLSLSLAPGFTCPWLSGG